MLRPTAIEVTAADEFKLIIKFDNGEVKIFDGSDLIKHKPFTPLQNIALFKTVRTNGVSVEWNDDIDICPDDLYYGSKIIV